MGLRITSFSLHNFRSYEYYHLDQVADVVLFVGPNAVGKTNLIEALQLCTACTSFRNPKADHLVSFGMPSASVSVCIGDGLRQLTLDLQISEGKKVYQLNGKRKLAHTLRGLLPAVLFCPDDLDLAKGSSRVKRSQVDALGSQLSSNYHAVRKDYEKILQQKNRYLKGEVSHTYLESINEVVAQIGSQLFILRLQLIKELEPYLKTYYRLISGRDEEAGMSYLPSWILKTDGITLCLDSLPRDQVRESLRNVMEANYHQEHERHHALYGPHTDKIMFSIDGRDATLFASQGQQRSIVLAYKLAEVALICDRLNQSPVLLLDDVMSELDSYRRSSFMRCIPNSVQTFITSTNLGYFDTEVLERAQVIELGEQ